MLSGAVFIVEGVAGSGKDTLVQQLVAALQPEQRPVLVWSEAAVLASWHHYYVPGIDEQRLALTESLTEYMQRALAAQPETVFVFNRFHVSHAVWRAEKRNDTAELEARHHRLVARLHELPVRILHPTIAAAEADDRSAHPERRDLAWQQFLERRSADMGFASHGALYARQQELMARVLDRDGLPYQRLTVVHGRPLDIAGLLGSHAG